MQERSCVRVYVYCCCVSSCIFILIVLLLHGSLFWLLSIFSAAYGCCLCFSYFMLSVCSQLRRHYSTYAHTHRIRKTERRKKSANDNIKSPYTSFHKRFAIACCAFSISSFCFVKQLTSDNHSVLLCRWSINTVPIVAHHHIIVSSMRLGIL